MVFLKRNCVEKDSVLFERKMAGFSGGLETSERHHLIHPEAIYVLAFCFVVQCSISYLYNERTSASDNSYRYIATSHCDLSVS